MIRKTIVAAAIAAAAILTPAAPALAGNCDCTWEAVGFNMETLEFEYALICPPLITCQDTVPE
jgi:hypothetical protein